MFQVLPSSETGVDVDCLSYLTFSNAGKRQQKVQRPVGGGILAAAFGAWAGTAEGATGRISTTPHLRQLSFVGASCRGWMMRTDEEDRAQEHEDDDED